AVFDCRGIWRISRLPSEERVKGSLVRAPLSDRGRFDYWLHRVSLADSSRIADQSRDLRLCQSGGGSAGRLLSWRRSARPANNFGNTAGAGQRRGNYYDQSTGGGTSNARYRRN